MAATFSQMDFKVVAAFSHTGFEVAACLPLVIEVVVAFSQMVMVVMA